MLRLTKKADYGLMALKYLAEQPDGRVPAARRRLPRPTTSLRQLLAKILQTLAGQGCWSRMRAPTAGMHWPGRRRRFRPLR